MSTTDKTPEYGEQLIADLPSSGDSLEELSRLLARSTLFIYDSPDDGAPGITRVAVEDVTTTGLDEFVVRGKEFRLSPNAQRIGLVATESSTEIEGYEPRNDDNFWLGNFHTIDGRFGVALDVAETPLDSTPNTSESKTTVSKFLKTIIPNHPDFPAK